MAGGSYGEFEIARWVGAVFYWILSGCQKKLSEHLGEKYSNRNAWTGYLLFLIFLSGFFYLIIIINS
jgi:hypothetical protein